MTGLVREGCLLFHNRRESRSDSSRGGNQASRFGTVSLRLQFVSFAPPGLTHPLVTPRLAPWAAVFRSFGAETVGPDETRLGTTYVESHPHMKPRRLPIARRSRQGCGSLWPRRRGSSGGGSLMSSEARET